MLWCKAEKRIWHKCLAALPLLPIIHKHWLVTGMIMNVVVCVKPVHHTIVNSTME